jgi:hypothetical protein
VKMVTEISGAGVSHSSVAQTVAPLSSRIAEISRPSIVGLAAKEALGDLSRERQAISASQFAGAYSQLRNRQEALNSAASVVREVGNTAEKAGQLLNRMESELGAVVKMYPPYPVDSPERVQMLNNFGGLRKQIEALTFPPAESLDAVGRLLGNQANGNADAGEVAKAASLVKEPMWDILALDSMTASDADVRKTLDRVKSTKSLLQDLHIGIWKDVINFVQQADPSAAENGSTEVRKQLVARSANEVSSESHAGMEQAGIGRNAGQFVQAVESR